MTRPDEVPDPVASENRAPDKPAPHDLATEAVNPRTGDLDRLSTADLVALVFEEDRAVQRACAAVAAAVALVADRAAAGIARGGRLIYVGAGSSGRLGVLDASEVPPTFGVGPGVVVARIAGGRDAVFAARERAEDRAEDGRAEMGDLAVGQKDVVVGIAASGRTPYTLEALAEARARGAFTCAIVSNRLPEGVEVDSVVYLDTGPEVLAGSTRMKAGTAAKMALNALSLATMVRLGKVHGNRMVDLKIGSRKLRDRAVALVRDLAGVDTARARDLLAASAGRVKTAVVMARHDLDATEAETCLREAGDVLRAALGSDTFGEA